MGIYNVKAVGMMPWNSLDYFGLVDLQALPTHSIENVLYISPLQVN